MFTRKIVLLAISLLSIVFVFATDAYHEWMFVKILGPGFSIFDQIQNTESEHRMAARFGISYSIYRNIRSTINRLEPNSATVLLPPKGYLKDRKLGVAFEMVEPAVFYYFTGLNGVDVNSPDLSRAGWAIEVVNREVGVRKISRKEERDSLIAIFKKYQN